MKKTLIFLIISILCLPVLGEHVSFADARKVAVNWTAGLGTNFKNFVSIAGGEPVIFNGTTAAYVFHLNPRGYVIVSTEDYLPPIKMYSLKNNFGEAGKALEDLVLTGHLEIIDKVNASQIDPDTFFSGRNKQAFRLLRDVPLVSGDRFPGGGSGINETAGGMDRINAVEEVSPFLTTMWYQREPYNLLCPEVDGERSVTGCVATAFAQIMKYYQYPPAGRGSWSYQTKRYNLNVSASFDHPYYWDRMLDSYPEPETGTQEQRDAVAQLMFDVGVSLNMDYSPEGSGASANQTVAVFPLFFDYSKEILYVSRLGMDDAEWFQLARDHVDHGLPVAFGIFRVDAGHMVVIDGYRISADAAVFHINLGWNGAYDGYYSLNNIVVRDSYFTVLEWQSYVLNMVPPSLEATLPGLSIGASAYEDKSLLQHGYYCELTWKGIPGFDADIDRYVIIRHDGVTWETSYLGEVDHSGQTDLYHYTFRQPHFTQDAYSVYAVTHTDEWNRLLFCNLILRD